MIYCHIVEGSFDGEKFKEFVEGVVNTMQPYPSSRSVLVMDNCRIHHHEDIERIVHGRCVLSGLHYAFAHNASRGCRLEYLPPYSPDFNPIEFSFSWMKQELKRKGYISKDVELLEWYYILYQLVFSVTPQISRAYFRNCGYY